MRVTLTVLLLAAQEAMAHPGHGPEAGWLHFFTEADHLALLMAPAVIGVVAWRGFVRRRRGGRS